MTNPTPDQIRLAREIYRQYGEREAREAGSDLSKDWVHKVLTGEADANHGIQIALAAIIEVTERAAKTASNYSAAATFALRNGEHLK